MEEKWKGIEAEYEGKGGMKRTMAEKKRIK